MDISREEFREIILGNYLNGREIVIVNIGTEKYIGDSFGPLLGSMLEGQLNAIKVYGTLNDTIMGTNLEDKIKIINKRHKHDFIIGTDCAFTADEKCMTADFTLVDQPLYPGLGMGKTLPAVGDMCIKFCIGQSDPFDTCASLKSPFIKEIYNRARKAAEFIFEIDEELVNINKNRQLVK